MSNESKSELGCILISFVIAVTVFVAASAWVRVRVGPPERNELQEPTYEDSTDGRSDEEPEDEVPERADAAR